MNIKIVRSPGLNPSSELCCCDDAYLSVTALQKKPEEMNTRAADMWSYAILLWELATREVPFADLTPMEIGMKVLVFSPGP